MENWDKVQQEIEIETNDYFKEKNYDIGELIKVLQKVLMAPVDKKYNIDGVAVKIPKAMFEILDDDATKSQQILNFEVLSRFEPFLRKLLLLLNPQKYQKLVDEKKGLAAIINALKMNPHRIDYDDEEANANRTYTDYDYHLFRVYKLRNSQSHEMKQWKKKELDENIESIFIFYFETLNKHKNALQKIILSQQNNVPEYIASVIDEFEMISRQFISTESIEDFSVFESYAIEHRTLVSEGETAQERAGTVDFIRKKRLPENRMLLWGDAGMGKSTTLQYLAYLDAKEYQEGKSDIIPVYIPLGMLIDKEETLEQYICRKISVEYLTCVEMFENGTFSLFLDGVNEIPVDSATGLHSCRLKEIQNLLDIYPNMFILLSNRPDRYNFFKGIPVFRLEKMNYKKIQEFLQKNADIQTRDIIIKGIENNHRLQQIIGTPLMTTRLIEIVRELHEFPQSEGTIIKKFLESLYKRERFEKKDIRFDASKINCLLTSLAYYGFQKNQTNSGLSNQEVIECFADCMNKLHFNYDSTYALEILLKLGVLGGDKYKEVIVFSHQAYQDYYLSCADKSANTQTMIEYNSLQNKTNVETRDITSANLCFETKLDACVEDTAEEKTLSLIKVQGDNTTLSNTDNYNELDAYYHKYANNNEHEKSIIYSLHTMDRNTRNESIKKLAQYNLLLAAKAISSGEIDSEIEEFIIAKALNKIKMKLSKKAKKAKSHITSILVFLELNRTEELKNNISVLIEDENLIRRIAMNLNGEQCVAFLDALIQQKESRNTIDALTHFLNACYLKEYEYSWTADNISMIKGITERLNELLRFHTSVLLKFYMSFNVPKEHMVDNISELLNQTIDSDFDLICDFIKNYGFDYKILLEKKIQIILSAFDKRHPFLKNLSASLSIDDKYEVLDQLMNNRYNRIAAFFFLPVLRQYEITKKHNVFFHPDDEISVRHISNLLSSLLTESEASYLFLDRGLHNRFKQDTIFYYQHDMLIKQLSFIDYMRTIRPNNVKHNDEELLDNSTIDDFVQYKEWVKLEIQQRQQQRQIEAFEQEKLQLQKETENRRRKYKIIAEQLKANKMDDYI